ASGSRRARAGIRRRCAADRLALAGAAEAAGFSGPAREVRGFRRSYRVAGLRSAPEPAGDAVAVVARPRADQRDLVHLRHAEQAQRVPVRDEGVDDVATLAEELQL